jgi:hypothetical protein
VVGDQWSSAAGNGYSACSAKTPSYERCALHTLRMREFCLSSFTTGGSSRIGDVKDAGGGVTAALTSSCTITRSLLQVLTLGLRTTKHVSWTRTSYWPT